MEQERPSTPEKQLLNLIEDPKEQDLSQKKIKRGSFSLFSFSALRGRLSFFLKGIRSGSLIKEAFFNIKGLNKILRFASVLLFVYLIANFSMSYSNMSKVPDFISKSTRPSKEITMADFSPKLISDYLEGPRVRNIFRFNDSQLEVKEEAKEGHDEVAPPVEKSLSNAELLAQNLGLVGIGWSKNPDVMLENIESKKMYFLKRGDRIDGLIKVEAIFQDKVILTYGDGKELELR